MTTRRRYTAKERAAAVGIATLDGVTATERQTGIPKTTVQYWMDKPEFVQLRTKSREAVAAEMWTAIQVGLKEVVAGLSGDAPLRDKATAVGILYDKHALLMGLATSRVESIALTDGLDDHEKAALRKVIDQVIEAV